MANRADEAFANGDLKFTLDGSRLHGSWVLVRMRGDRFARQAAPVAVDQTSRCERQARRWRCIAARGSLRRLGSHDRANCRRVSASGPNPSCSRPASGAPMRCGARRRASVRAAPAAAHADGAKNSRRRALRRAAAGSRSSSRSCARWRRPSSTGWAHEVKFDGYRAQLRVQSGRAVIRTRSGLDWTERFTAIAQEAAALPDCLIDGEVAVLDPQRPAELQRVAGRAVAAQFCETSCSSPSICCSTGREDLRPMPLVERKARLERLLASAGAGRRIRYVAHLESDAEAVLASARRWDSRASSRSDWMRPTARAAPPVGPKPNAARDRRWFWAAGPRTMAACAHCSPASTGMAAWCTWANRYGLRAQDSRRPVAASASN